MEHNKHYLAAYGTLRRPYGNSRLVDRKTNWLGEGVTVEMYEMRASGIPFVNKTPSTNIVVDVWEIDDEQLENCDRLEGHPEWYKRELIDVKIGEDVKQCWLYFNDSSAPIVESGDFKKQ
jgi:gamma-glutamylcyclotransferase (GGCT)/AIG2-like uncharacterized protein YtfP